MSNGMQNEEDVAGSGDESQVERATEALRDLVLRGTFPAEVKLPEAHVANLLGVSRTPARLAMAALERDGLLMQLPRRGFRVRSFSLEEVVEAIEVRGEIEAVAARVTSEKGLLSRHSERLKACIDRAEKLIGGSEIDAKSRREWCEINSAFHSSLLDASGLRPLRAAYDQVNLVPLASPYATIFNVSEPELTRRQLTVAHEEHVRILRAITDRHSMRAAALMREHAYRSGENKRLNFPHIEMQRLVVEAPGLALVSNPERADSTSDTTVRAGRHPNVQT